MIEKTINYCWFGGKEKPELVRKCIDSWKRYFPGYEIVEWNEQNFDLNYCPYVSEAYSRRRWAFVSDFARLKIIYENGGIYFDTDVEVLKSFGDITNQKYFLGLEEVNRINTGVGFGAEKGSSIVRAMMDMYNDRHFISEDGKENPLVCPVYNTKALVSLGVELQSEGITHFMGGSIYPEDYFSPINLRTGILQITNNTYSIHHFENSWMTKKQKLRKKFYQKYGEKYIYPAIKCVKKILHIGSKKQ